MSPLPPILLLGVGQTGRAIFKQAAGTRLVTGTTRNPLRVFELAELGISPLILPLPHGEIVEPLARDALVVATFPPDTEADQVFSSATSAARRVIYLSSTAVYGRKEGTIDDTTEADHNDPHTRARLNAESLWHEHGAIVLRVPGIYSADSGLHKRLVQGDYKLPGDGSRYVSRIHVDDLAGIILKLLDLETEPKLKTYVVGDKSPCPVKEIVGWLCEKLDLPMPPSAPLEAVHVTQRGNRSINAENILCELNYQLRYPDYRAGYGSILAAAAD